MSPNVPASFHQRRLDLLSFGKARELAGMGQYAFGQLLSSRHITPHYGPDELEDDIAYAHGQ